MFLVSALVPLLLSTYINNLFFLNEFRNALNYVDDTTLHVLDTKVTKVFGFLDTKVFGE